MCGSCGRTSRSARGVTFLEMVVAVSLLAIVAAASFSALEFVMGMQRREQQRLGAAELGSALIVQYLDDPTTMPAQSEPLEYGAWMYRYTLSDEPVTMRSAKPIDLQTGPGGAARPTTLDRIRQVTVRVWLSSESGGADGPGEGAAGFALTRLIDPIAVRNPDSFENQIRSEERQRIMAEEMRGRRPPGGSGAPGEQRAPGNRGAPGDGEARPRR